MKVLQGLDSCKATSEDRIGPGLLRTTAPGICRSITLLHL